MVPCDTLIKVHAQQASELYRMVEDLSNFDFSESTSYNNTELQ